MSKMATELARLEMKYTARVLRLVSEGEMKLSDLPEHPFCAVCTGERGPFDRLPLGRRDAMVWVCNECDETHPRMDRDRYGYGGGREVGGVAIIATGDNGRTREKRGR